MHTNRAPGKSQPGEARSRKATGAAQNDLMEHRTVSQAQANRLHARQADFEAAIKAYEEAKARRDEQGALDAFVGLLSTVALVPLSVLNSGNDAPVFEVLLGLTGADPWPSPLGPIQPMAVVASLLVVGAMGLASIYALRDEHLSHTAPQDTQQEQRKEDRPRAPRRLRPPRVKRPTPTRIIAAAVMLGLVAIVSYGGYLRAIITDAGQNPWASAGFAGALALIEELAVVSSAGYLMHQLPVVHAGLRLRWYRLLYAGVQGQGVAHGSVATAARETRTLLDRVQATHETIIRLRRELAGVAATAVANHTDAWEVLTAKQDTVKTLEAERDLSASWHASFATKLTATRERLDKQLQPDTASLPPVAQIEEAIQTDLTDPYTRHKQGSDERVAAARSQAARFKTTAHDAVTRVAAGLGDLHHEADSWPRTRTGILAGARIALGGPDFEQFPAVSQVATFQLAAQLVAALDGETSGAGDANPSLQKTAETSGDLTAAELAAQRKALIVDLQRRETTAPPPLSPISAAQRALNATVTELTAAQTRLGWNTTSAILAQDAASDGLAGEITAMHASSASAIDTLKAELLAKRADLQRQRQEIQRKRLQEQRAQYPLARLLRFVSRKLHLSHSDPGNALVATPQTAEPVNLAEPLTAVVSGPEARNGVYEVEPAQQKQALIR